MFDVFVFSSVWSSSHVPAEACAPPPNHVHVVSGCNFHIGVSYAHHGSFSNYSGPLGLWIFFCFFVFSFFFLIYWVSQFWGDICSGRVGLGHVQESALDFSSKETQNCHLLFLFNSHWCGGTIWFLVPPPHIFFWSLWFYFRGLLLLF